MLAEAVNMVAVLNLLNGQSIIGLLLPNSDWDLPVGFLGVHVLVLAAGDGVVICVRICVLNITVFL